MGQRLARVPGAGVRHERDAAHLEADPAGRDALEDGRHPDGVRPERGEHADLGRGLVGRPGQPDVDALLEVDALGGAGRVERRPQARTPGVHEVREARPELVRVRADERAAAGQVDVIAHDHERPRAEARVEATGGVGQHDDPRPERLEQQDRLDDESRVVALVHVEAALEHDDGPAGQRAQQQPADVPGRRRRWPAGQVRERDRDRVGQVVGESAEPGSEHDAELRDEARPGADGGRERGDAGRLLDGRDGARRVDVRRSSGSSGASCAHRTRWPGPDFAGPTSVSTPGCRSRPVGRSLTTAAVRRRRRGNEAPEATGGGAEVLDAISGPSILSAPSGKTYVTGGPTGWVNAVIHEVAGRGRTGIHELSAAVDRLWRTTVSRPSRTSRSSATSRSPRTGARSSGRHAAARSSR